jgi:hypothetical protein
MFKNNTNYMYNLYVDGVHKLKNNNTKIEDFKLFRGAHVTKAEQVTGVFFFHSVETCDFEVPCGK